MERTREGTVLIMKIKLNFKKKLSRRDTSLKKATLITAVSRYSVIIMNILFNSILARILTPGDYGVVAVVSVFTNFFTLFSDMGIGAGVIQNDLSETDQNKIFSFTIPLGIGLMFVFSMFSIVLVHLYRDNLYYGVTCCVSLSLLFSTLNMVPNALLRKQKRFVEAGFRNIITAIASYLIAIILAILGWKYYAIVFQSVISNGLLFLWNFHSSGLKVDFKENWKSVNKIFNYSIFQFGFNVVNYFSRNLDNLLTGIFFSSEALGYYDKAYKLVRMPVQNISYVITPSLHPILSEHQDNTQYILNQYNKIVKLLSIIGVYITAMCFFASHEIIYIMFGSQWGKSVISFRLLSITIIFQMIGGIGGSIYQCMNKTKEMFYAGILGTILTVVAIIIGIFGGTIENLSFCYSISAILNFTKDQLFLAHTCFKVKLSKLLNVYFKESLILVALFLVMSLIPAHNNLIISFVIKGFICTVVYIGMLFLTKEMSFVLSFLPEKLKKQKFYKMLVKFL